MYLVIDAFNFLLIAAGASIKAGPKMMDVFDGLVMKMIQRLSYIFPGYEMIAVWDEFGGTDFRKNINSDYKSNRNSSFISINEILSMKQMFSTFNIQNISIPFTEADDVIYCLCKVLKERDPQSMIEIISRDKDLLQVVQAGYADSVFDYTKKASIPVPQYSVVMYKSLVGDPSDNIKGVTGIGKKKAERLLSEYIVTGKLDLTESQLEEFNECQSIIDSSLHPRFEENLTKLKEIYERSQVDS